VIDCDVHVAPPTLATLVEYMEPGRRAWIAERGYKGPPSIATVYPPNAPGTIAPRWREREGAAPGADVATLQADVLGPDGAELAILNCYYGLDSVRHPDLAGWLASAVNDWLIAEWLDRDPRLRASLVVPSHTHADIVAEIERVGEHPGFVQVLMPVRNSQSYGLRNWWPVYEAMTRHDLVFGLHWGGTSDAAPTPTGWPSWYVEEYAGEQQVFMSQLTSMVSEGVFQRFPDLRVAVHEIGFGWLPSLLWRLDSEWKGLRRIVPWIDRVPSAIVRDNVRLSTAPMDAGPPDQLARIIEWVGPEMLMYASDYPHHHDDDLELLLGAAPADARDRILAGTARDFYGL
jgi:predicted TIM-barrel fold metal-dependent hydrolase